MKRIIVFAVFLLFFIGKDVMSQSCNGVNELCGNGRPCCAGAGVCKDVGLGQAQCQCEIDSYLSSCSSNAECCSGKCNSRGYCGCIASGRMCNHEKPEECCGKPSSGSDGHLIQTCSAAWIFPYVCF